MSAPAGLSAPAPARRPRDPAALGRRRTAEMTALLVVAAVVAVLVQLLAVAPRLDPAQILAGILGTQRGARLILLTFRAPRLVVGALAGASLGLSGAIVQRLLRNPLASPDVLGVTSGASLAAMAAMVLLGWSGWRVSLLAALGALAVAVLIALAAGGGGRAGGRLVLVGVAVGSVASSTIAMLTTALPSSQVSDALAWLSGSLAPATWERAAWLAVGLAVLLPATAARRRSLEVLEIDADVAGALGSRPRRDALVLLGLAVLLAALATAAAGPIAFIAFCSGPLSRMLLRGRQSLAAAAAAGSALTLLADAVAQLLPSGPYPVGVVTGAAGAPFLLWVLLRRAGSPSTGAAS